MTYPSYPDPDGLKNLSLRLVESTKEIKQEVADVPSENTDNVEDAVQHNRYYPYAKEVKALIQARFPHGAMNRKDVTQKLGVENEELQTYLSVFDKFFNRVLCPKNLEDVKGLTDLMQPVLFGNCGIFTYYALSHLKNKYPDLNVESVSLNNHTFLVIGRNPTSNPLDINNWGTDALVCDLWASQCYLATDFFKLRESTHHIPYHFKENNNLPQEHFLTGNPKATVNPFSLHSQKYMMNWVLEDQKRWLSPLITAPKSPLAAKVKLDPVKVKSALSQLSRHEGWKYNIEAGMAWCPCQDARQAQRIVDTLKATKAMVVSLPNKTYGVKCEYIQLDKIQQMIQSLDMETNSLASCINM